MKRYLKVLTIGLIMTTSSFGTSGQMATTNSLHNPKAIPSRPISLERYLSNKENEIRDLQNSLAKRLQSLNQQEKKAITPYERREFSEQKLEIQKRYEQTKERLKAYQTLSKTQIGKINLINSDIDELTAQIQKQEEKILQTQEKLKKESKLLITLETNRKKLDIYLDAASTNSSNTPKNNIPHSLGEYLINRENDLGIKRKALTARLKELAYKLATSCQIQSEAMDQSNTESELRQVEELIKEQADLAKKGKVGEIQLIKKDTYRVEQEMQQQKKYIEKIQLELNDENNCLGILQDKMQELLFCSKAAQPAIATNQPVLKLPVTKQTIVTPMNSARK